MHCYNFPETSLPAGNDCAGSVLLKYTVDFRNTEGKKKKKKIFPEVLIKAFVVFFPSPKEELSGEGNSYFP